MNIRFISKSYFIFAYIFLCVVVNTVSVQTLEAVEPEQELYSQDTTTRETIYRKKIERLDLQLAETTDEKKKQHYLVQQQLLTKLMELPERPEKPAAELRFSALDLKKKLSWTAFENYLKRYSTAIRESELSDKQLQKSNKEMRTLHSRLLALGKDDEEQDILQLQYGFQVRKVEQQTEVANQLKEGLRLARQQFPEVLNSVTIYNDVVFDQEETLQQQSLAHSATVEERELDQAGHEVLIQQQHSVVAGYLGRELSGGETKVMHYEQLRLLDLQVQQLLHDNSYFQDKIGLLELKQKTLWMQLLAGQEEFFAIADSTGDIAKSIGQLMDKVDNGHNLIYGYEKKLSTLRGGNAQVGPKAAQLITSLDERVKTVFTELSAITIRSENLDKKGTLLDRAVNHKQSAIGSMVTRTKEATDDMLEKIFDILRYPLLSYSGMSLSLLLILQIVLLLSLGILINRLYMRAVLRVGRKRNWSQQTIHLTQVIGKYPFIFIVAMIILSVSGFNTSSLALVAGALSVGIGFGMQTIVNNLVSGIILLFDKSIKPGDFICLGDGSPMSGFRGNVVQMNIRATVLRTNDNINVIIPNADLMASQVVNWTYSDERVRFRIPFSVAYGTDVNMVKQLIKDAMVKLSVVLSEPEPQIWMSAHGDSSLAFLAAIWVEGVNARRPSRINDVVLTAIYNVLEENDIEIPFPQMDLRLRSKEQQDLAGIEYQASMFGTGRIQN